MENEDDSDSETLAILDRLMMDDDDDEDIIDMFLIPLICKNSLRRNGAIFWKRWDSEYMRNLAVDEGSFVAEYRVDPGGFDILLEVLGDSLRTNTKFSALAMAESGSKEITPASRLGAALIMLGGGRRLEAMRTHGIARSTTYANFFKVIRAINSNPLLAIECNNEKTHLQRRANGFKELSQHGIFQHCTGAIDGLAIHIRAPSCREVQNQSRFFSGNKKKYCLNMQGVCDRDCKFIAVTCKHVGSTNDAVAFVQGTLKTLCEAQTFPYHWNGDNAYTLSETMMVPFSGSNLSTTFPTREWFNFWHSQVRITIERTFGIFVQRFGILWQALKYSLSKNMEIVHACCRLHNFCLSRNLPVLSSRHVPAVVSNVDVNGRLTDESWRSDIGNNESWGPLNTGSTLRDELVNVIGRNNYAHIRNYK